MIANGCDVNTTINNPEAVGGLTLTGTYSLRDIRTGYIVSNNAFYNVSSLLSNNNLWKDAAGNAISEENRHVYVSPFHAYLAGTIPEARQAALLRIDTGGTTAVEAVEAYMVKPNTIICTSDSYLSSGNENLLLGRDVFYGE